MTPLPIDERRVARLSDACDLIDDERPRVAGWKERRDRAYRALADACNLAADNARTYLQDHAK
jgi:hypothetical protein